MAIKFRSLLRDANSMSVDRVDGLIESALRVGHSEAVRQIGEDNYVIRSLHAGDLPPTGTTARLWLETTGTTTEVFVAAAIGDGTQINDDTVIALYGARWIFAERPNINGNNQPHRPPVSSLRIVVGGTRVAEWDLWGIFRGFATRGGSSSDVTSSVAVVDYPMGIAESPIIVGPRKNLLFEYYEMTATASDFSLQILGHVIEKTGAGDGLSP